MFANVVALVVFAGVLIASGLLFGMGASRRKARSLELARRLGPAETQLQMFRDSQLDPLGEWLGPLGTWLHSLAVQAGVRWGVAEIVFGSVLVGAAGLFGTLWLAQGPLRFIGLLALAVPTLYLLRLGQQRTRRITQQLPDALDLISRALRSGHAFSDALRIAATEMPSPIRDVLAPVAEQHRLGLELRACLDGLLERVPSSFELRLLVSSVLLHRDTGGNLIEILDHLAETVRERVIFEDKVQALTAEVRMSARILESLPFLAAFLLSIAAPGYLGGLFAPGLGRTMLVAGAASMVIGILVMRRIAQVEA